MSLKMRICYGRTNPFVEPEVQGKEGPTLLNIESANYSGGDLFLKFDDSESLITAQKLTRWMVAGPSPFSTESRFIPALKTNFAYPLDTREFVSIEDKQSKEAMYYSDFILYCDDPSDTMQLRLYMGYFVGKSFPPERREMIIDNVESLRFTFGRYRIWLECHESRCAAEKLTDWKEGLDGMGSLEMALKPDNEAILTHDPVYPGTKPLMFYHFELKVVKNNSVST